MAGGELIWPAASSPAFAVVGSTTRSSLLSLRARDQVHTHARTHARTHTHTRARANGHERRRASSTLLRQPRRRLGQKILLRPVVWPLIKLGGSWIARAQESPNRAHNKAQDAAKLFDEPCKSLRLLLLLEQQVQLEPCRAGSQRTAVPA